MGFSFVSGERARRLDELTTNPPPPPKGAWVRKVPRKQRRWEVLDQAGRVLGTWATYPAALRDAERYQAAERAYNAKMGE